MSVGTHTLVCTESLQDSDEIAVVSNSSQVSTSSGDRRGGATTPRHVPMAHSMPSSVKVATSSSGGPRRRTEDTARALTLASAMSSSALAAETTAKVASLSTTARTAAAADENAVTSR